MSYRNTAFSEKYLILFPVFILLVGIKGWAQDEIIMESEFLDKPDTIWVFSPEKEMDPRALVYMLHGWNGSYKQWNRIINLQKYADSLGFVFVCPDGFEDSWYFNAVKSSDPVNYADFFIHDLLPRIDSIVGKKIETRFITGLSMGGYGSFYIYLNYPEYFTAAFSSSGTFDLTLPIMRKYGLEKRLGDPDKYSARYSKMSILNIAKRKNISSGQRYYFDCGKNDPFFDCNKELYDYLKSKTQDVKFRESEGEHSSHYWKRSIQKQFKLMDEIKKR